MVRKNIAIAIILATIVCLIGILVPSLLIAANSDSPSVTRLYADDLAGPWSATSSHTTRWVEKITVVNGQTTIVIQEVGFMWEAPTGTLVFFGGIRGNTGPQGPQGPQGPAGIEIGDQIVPE